MKFELSPVTSHIRIFKDGNKSSEARDPYDAIITIQFLNYDIVYLSGLNGIVTRAGFNALMAFLKENGAKEVQYERKGKVKTIKLEDD